MSETYTIPGHPEHHWTHRCPIWTDHALLLRSHDFNPVCTRLKGRKVLDDLAGRESLRGDPGTVLE